MRDHAALRTGILVLFLAVTAAGCQKTGVNAANENSQKASETVGSLPVWDADFLVDAEKWESRQRGLTQAALNRARGADVQSYAQMVMDDHARTLQQLGDLMKKKGSAGPPWLQKKNWKELIGWIPCPARPLSIANISASWRRKRSKPCSGSRLPPKRLTTVRCGLMQALCCP